MAAEACSRGTVQCRHLGQALVGRLRLDGDAGGTAAAALWWLSDTSVAMSDLEGGKVVKGVGQGPYPVKGPWALVFSMVTGKSTYRAVCDTPSHIVATG